MKRVLYLIMPALMFSLAGCGETEKPFRESAAVRIQKAVNEVSQILLDGENGWIMRYFPNTGSWGGFNMYVKFNDDTTADIRLLDRLSDMPDEMYSASGIYEVKAEQSVMLTFDTFNSALHYFALTSGGLNLSADYEFLPKEWESGRLLLQGKKYGFFAELVALPAGETADTYMEKIEQSRADTESAGLRLTVKGNPYRVRTDFARRQISYIDARNSTVRLPYVYTTGGIKFYEPVTIDGVEISELNYDGNGKFTNTQGNVEIEKFTPTNYEIFAVGQAWYFTTKNDKISAKFLTAWDRKGNTSEATPQSFYFSENASFQPQLATVTKRSNGYNEDVNLMLVLTDEGDNKVTMKYKSMQGGRVAFDSGGYWAIVNTFFGLTTSSAQNATQIEEAAKAPAYKGRTYIIEVDDIMNPKELTLTAADDSDYWFKLSADVTTTVL